MKAAAVLVAAALLLQGCATMPSAFQPSACALGEHPAQVAQLFFGRNVGDRVGVGEEDFRRFVDEELSPRFPDGLTVIDAAGQWRGATGLVREPSKVVVIVLPSRADGRAKIAAATQAYKARFHQEAVLVLVETACAAF